MKKMINPDNAFWITNISNRDVALSDLGLTIRSMTSINLMDRKHYPHLTQEVLTKSEQSGSLFKKSDKVKHRRVPPPMIKQEWTPVDTSSVIPTRQHSIVEIKQEQYEELNIVNDDELISNITDEPPTDT